MVGRSSNLVDFLNVDMSELLTEDQFNKAYPTSDYEHYTEENIRLFINDLRKADFDELEKAKKDYSKLQKKTITVSRGGKTFQKIVYIKPKDSKKEDKGKENKGDKADAQKRLKDSLSRGQRRMVEDKGGNKLAIATGYAYSTLIELKNNDEKEALKTALSEKSSHSVEIKGDILDIGIGRAEGVKAKVIGFSKS